MMQELKDDQLLHSADEAQFTSRRIGTDISLNELPDYVVMNNDIVQVTISKPGGIVTGVKYGGIDNLLEYNNTETNRGYWDMNWSQNGGKDNFYVVSGTSFNVVYKDADRVEVSFVRLYDPKSGSGVPLNIDKRFVLLQESSGFYSYGIYERLSGWPAFHLNQTRITFKLSNDKFHYMAIADDRQRLMPRPEDLMPDRSQQLTYPGAHLLTNPIEPDFTGEVDDKYQYSMENKELKVHGWVSADPMVGFWIISPSAEFRNGGPMKQNLTSHVGPTCLSMFHSAHYAGFELCPGFEEGEAWKKVFGPVFIYLNSAPTGTPYPTLWQNAQAQAKTERKAWPYSWPASADFPKAGQRSSVCGRLLVSDLFQAPYTWAGKCAFLGLATPGETGSWQTESKGYQFWTQADANANFCIKNVRAGKYDLYGWVPGVVGDYKFKNGPINIQPGVMISLGDIHYSSPRDGPTVWEIGVPNRTANGFFVPDPNPKYVNKLYLNSSRKEDTACSEEPALAAVHLTRRQRNGHGGTSNLSRLLGFSLGCSSHFRDLNLDVWRGEPIGNLSFIDSFLDICNSTIQFVSIVANHPLQHTGLGY
ncbi:hypothetical protein KC19_10G089400 [Ceratodon purpureus]|uniref:Rhamnogalacturonan lyase domain-containing protein n=1 Tax=Ceratodon purpureus TaxID=3225 RepID=A0A8T0GKZ4_CERPU|nr:hypothetical protein KC19_10G089400 [Ceratodon purpureus]